MYTKKIFLFCIALLSLTACKNKSTTSNANSTNQSQMGLTQNEIKEIKQHLKDQKRVETEESDGNEQENPYVLKQRDLELANIVINEGLKNNGYKAITDEAFAKKNKEIFGLENSVSKNHVVNDHKGFVTIFGMKAGEKKDFKSKEFDLWFYTKNIFLVRNGHFITIMDVLSNLIKINDDNTYKIIIEPYIIHRNKYLYNDDKASLVWLLNNDQSFLEKLITDFGYDKDSKINKMVLDSLYKEYTQGNSGREALIGDLFFVKDSQNKLQIREGLLKYVENNTSATDNRLIYALGNYAWALYDGDEYKIFDKDPSKKFTALEKAKITAYIANIEKPAIEKYKTFDSTIWNNSASTLYNLSVKNPELIKLIEQNNYFGLPKMKGIIEKLPEEAPPAPGDPE